MMRFLIPIIFVLIGMFVGCDRLKATQVVALLPEAKDVSTESRVTYRGLEVGHVTGTRIVENGVEVVMAITRSDLQLRRGDQVRTYNPALLSDVSNVEIVPGPSDTALLQPGEKLTAAPPVGSVTGKEIIEALRAVGNKKSGSLLPDHER